MPESCVARKRGLAGLFDMAATAHEACACCAETLLRGKRCSRCKQVVYCTKECQRKDWQRHKRSCTPVHPTPHSGVKNIPDRAQELDLRGIGRQICCAGHADFDVRLDLDGLAALRKDVLKDSMIWPMSTSTPKCYGNFQGHLDKRFASCAAFYESNVLRVAKELGRTHPLLDEMSRYPIGTMGISINEVLENHASKQIVLKTPRDASMCIMYILASTNARATITHHRNIPDRISNDRVLIYNCSSSSRTKVEVHLLAPSATQAGVNTTSRCEFVGLFHWFFATPVDDIQSTIESYIPSGTLCETMPSVDEKVDSSTQSLVSSSLTAYFQASSQRAAICAHQSTATTLDYDDDFIHQQQAIYDSLLKDITVKRGFEASHAGRKRILDKEKAGSLQYGEITFRSLAIGLQLIKRKYSGLPSGRGTFVDLGSGTGKTCVAAALIHSFERVVGIELITDLYDISVGVKQIYCAYTASMRSKPTSVEFFNDDIVQNSSWHDADVVFANTLAFNAALIAKLTRSAMNMKEGAFFMSSGNLLTDDFHQGFELLEFQALPYSWGMSSVYLHRRNKIGAPKAGQLHR